MTLQQIKYFIEVSRTKNFTQASQNLFVSQPSLSHSIRVLEKELDVPLFVRSNGKKVTLTSYGKNFLPYCQQVLMNLDDGKNFIQQMRNPMSGIVNISYSYINGCSLVPSIFNQFYKENNYSELSIKFKVNHSYAKFEKDVQSGNADLAFACTQFYEGLNVIPIAKQELVLMLPINHPLAKEKKLPLEAIKDEPILYYYKDSNLYHWIKKMFQYSNLKTDIETDSKDWSSQISYVSLGLGISISPRLPVDPALISVVEIDHPLNYRNIYMLWAKDRKLTNATEYVRQYCINYSKAHFGDIKDE